MSGFTTSLFVCACSTFCCAIAAGSGGAGNESQYLSSNGSAPALSSAANKPPGNSLDEIPSIATANAPDQSDALGTDDSQPGSMTDDGSGRPIVRRERPGIPDRSVAIDMVRVIPARDAVRDARERVSADLFDFCLLAPGAVECEEFRFDESCLGDIDQDGVVGDTDIDAIFRAWGVAEDWTGDAADLDGNSMIDAFDLAVLLARWGECQ